MPQCAKTAAVPLHWQQPTVLHMAGLGTEVVMHRAVGQPGFMDIPARRADRACCCTFDSLWDCSKLLGANEHMLPEMHMRVWLVEDQTVQPEELLLD